MRKSFIISFFAIILILSNACALKTNSKTQCKELSDSLNKLFYPVAIYPYKIDYNAVLNLADKCIQCDSMVYEFYNIKLQALIRMEDYAEALKFQDIIMKQFKTSNYNAYFQKAVIYRYLSDTVNYDKYWKQATEKLNSDTQKYPDSIPVLTDYLFYFGLENDSLAYFSVLDSLLNKHPDNQALEGFKMMNYSEIYQSIKDLYLIEK